MCAACSGSDARAVIATMLELRSVAVETRAAREAADSDTPSESRTLAAIGSSVISRTPVLSSRSGSGA